MLERTPHLTALDKVREAGGDELVERLQFLDAQLGARVSATPTGSLRAPQRHETFDYDVAIVGGGLSLLYAPLLAETGARVVVLDRSSIGAAHREWNAGASELEALVRAGLVTRDELESFIIARYRTGVCRWFGGGSYPVTGVLDCAVDAGALLRHTRKLAEKRRVTLLDFTGLDAMAAGAFGVRLLLRSGEKTSELTARIVIDARGASSPDAGGDLVCPTVGGVMRGLSVPADTGDILVTTENVEDGKQHIWEGFPGRTGETTVYLFHYSPRTAVRSGGLLALYERFFELLPRYANGDGELVRPTFGIIPGWSRLSPAPRASLPRVALVGDAAARHSPLTYCGFGATLRSLPRVRDGITEALSLGYATIDCVVDDAPIHRATGLLAWMMAQPSRNLRQNGQINALLDAAFSTLHAAGNAVYASLLKDEMTIPELIRFLRQTARARPQVYRDVLTTVGARKAGLWSVGLARELLRV
ncbi:MAG: lycopene cyclase [Clostridia bacterium]|nr:lycopene cyclase [Deltaproteobacteria bacterium]